MKRLMVLGSAMLLTACNNGVRIGVGPQGGAGGTTSNTGTGSNAPATTDGSTVGSTNAATNVSATSTVATTTVGSTASSTAATSSTATGGATCNNLPGYPNIPGVYADISGGDIQGNWSYTSNISAGLADGSWGPPYSGNWLVLGQGTTMLEEFFLWTPNVALPTVGTAYPLSANFVVGNLASATDSRDPNNINHWYVYPPAAGPGSCTITYDELVMSGTGCARARFSCAGLVGSSTGQAIAVTNGFVVYGTGTTGP